jgi:hypothetical protein
LSFEQKKERKIKAYGIVVCGMKIIKESNSNTNGMEWKKEE